MAGFMWLWLSKPMGSHFGVGAPPILVYVGGDWDVHWGYGVLTHGHMVVSAKIDFPSQFPTQLPNWVSTGETTSNRETTGNHNSMNPKWFSAFFVVSLSQLPKRGTLNNIHRRSPSFQHLSVANSMRRPYGTVMFKWGAVCGWLQNPNPFRTLIEPFLCILR